MKKPDFIIIGAMKSATSTLHEQLAMQSGIFMSTPKEPNYFSDDGQYALGEDWYSDLFKDADPLDICGESSTHYTKLPDYPLTVKRMASFLDSPKLIYVMRHPIDRLVSHYIHQWTQNIIKSDINKAIDEFDELIDYSLYTKQLVPYFKQYGHGLILPVFTEGLKVNSQFELSRISEFIGYKGAVTWHGDLLEQNTSSQRFRTFKGRFIVDSKLVTLLRRRLVPKSIRDRVKQKLRLSERPKINATQMKKLAVIFDNDLALLGEMLGVELNCANYKQVVTEKELNWSNKYWGNQ